MGRISSVISQDIKEHASRDTLIDGITAEWYC